MNVWPWYGQCALQIIDRSACHQTIGQQCGLETPSPISIVDNRYFGAVWMLVVMTAGTTCAAAGVVAGTFETIRD
jgi:hypothetical protein